MKYRQLGKTGIKVSELSLGSWLTYGNKIDGHVTEEIIDTAYEAGINSFDTANGYNFGEAEKVLAPVLKKYPRESLVVATKVFFPMGDGPNDRGLSRKHITEQIHASLKRLDMEYVDILYCHRFDETTPLYETLRTLDDLVRQGKIFYIGVSEWMAAQIQEALGVQDHYLLDRIMVSQTLYNMLNRKLETEVLPLCNRNGIGQMVFSPLGQGMLTGKYKRNQVAPTGSRGSDKEMGEWMRGEYYSDENFNKLEKLQKISEEVDISMPHLALAWILSHKDISSAIIGATRKEQVLDNIKAIDIQLSAELLAKLDDILGQCAKEA